MLSVSPAASAVLLWLLGSIQMSVAKDEPWASICTENHSFFTHASLWNKSAVMGNDGGHVCSMHNASYDEQVSLCLRPYSDVISDRVKDNGHWKDCQELASIWHDAADGLDGSTSDYYFDIGANIGMCAVHVAAATSANVVAFEPSPANLFYLSNNFLMNKHLLNRLHLFPFGAGSSHQELPIFEQPENAGHSVVGASLSYNVTLGDSEMVHRGVVQIRPLDSFIQKPYPRIRLMKIDVEGFETAVLEGGRELLSSGVVKRAYVELSPFLIGQGSSRLQLMNKLIEYGFDFESMTTFDAVTFEEKGPFRGRAHAQAIACQEGPEDFANVLAVHRGSAKLEYLQPCD